jgi:hypothetical protein
MLRPACFKKLITLERSSGRAMEEDGGEFTHSLVITSDLLRSEVRVDARTLARLFFGGFGTWYCGRMFQMRTKF